MPRTLELPPRPREAHTHTRFALLRCEPPPTQTPFFFFGNVQADKYGWIRMWEGGVWMICFISSPVRHGLETKKCVGHRKSIPSVRPGRSCEAVLSRRAWGKTARLGLTSRVMSGKLGTICHGWTQSVFFFFFFFCCFLVLLERNVASSRDTV
jgi:hypothetical protein